MKLLVKFNLLLIAVFGVGLFLNSFAARAFLQRQAQSEILRQAILMSAPALVTRAVEQMRRDRPITPQRMSALHSTNLQWCGTQVA